jgi:hypothetical protein
MVLLFFPRKGKRKKGARGKEHPVVFVEILAEIEIPSCRHDELSWSDFKIYSYAFGCCYSCREYGFKVLFGASPF